MSLVGAEKLVGSFEEETPETQWIFPAETSADYLKDSLHFISQAEFSPPTFEDGTSADQQLKRKTAPRKKAAFDDDANDDGMDDFLDDGMFAPGGPTARNVIDEDRTKPKKSRKRRAGGEVDESVLDERARKRREREREKALKIKSALYVKEGDDEFDSDEDEAFFAREREIKARAEAAATSVHASFMDIPAATKRKPETLTQTQETDDMDMDVDVDDDDDDTSVARKVTSSQESLDDSGTDDTPVDQSEEEGRKRRRISLGDSDDDEEAPAEEASSKAADIDDDDAPAPSRRPRVRGGFVIDSDDDE